MFHQIFIYCLCLHPVLLLIWLKGGTICRLSRGLGPPATSGGMGPDHTLWNSWDLRSPPQALASMTLPDGVTLCVQLCSLTSGRKLEPLHMPDAGLVLPACMSLTSVSEVSPLLTSHRKSLPDLPSRPLVPSSFPFVPLFVPLSHCGYFQWLSYLCIDGSAM